MRIKKHGKAFVKQPDEKVEKFICKECGCEFTVKEDEYYVDKGSNYGSATYSTTIDWTSTVIDKLVCSCPECYKICIKDRQRNESYTYPSINTTTTPLINKDTPILDQDITITCKRV